MNDFSEILSKLTTSENELKEIWDKNELSLSQFIKENKKNKHIDEDLYNKYELMLSAEHVFYSYNRKFSRR